MSKKINLSLGIAAYNEEKNMQNLLLALFSQQGIGFFLKEIIVFLDGSTDNTKEQILALKNKKIKLLIGTKRRGKAARLNQICKQFSGDVLIIVDADVIIKDTKLIAKLLAKS